MSGLFKFRLARGIFVVVCLSLRFPTNFSGFEIFGSDFFYFEMVSRLLIGDNNLSKFWPAFQFARPSLKHSVLVTATDLDGLDHALSKTEEREQVIVSVLTSVLLDEIRLT